MLNQNSLYKKHYIFQDVTHQKELELPTIYKTLKASIIKNNAVKTYYYRGTSSMKHNVLNKKIIKLTLVVTMFTLLTASNFLNKNKLSDKKVLHVESYHAGFTWSDGISKAITDIMAQNNVTLKTIHMDTKRNKDEASIKKAALHAKKIIKEYKPDLVIATDDNASKYLIVPYFMKSDIPFVFAGLNWDASKYNFPQNHITGMVEVNSVDELLELVHTLTPSNGKRIALLSADTLSAYKESLYTRKLFNVDFVAEEHVSNFEEWKRKFIELQDKADILYLNNMQTLDGFNEKEALDFIDKHTKIVTCSTLDFLADFVAISYARLSSEQGEWAASTAIKILQGTHPADIPVTKNRKGKIYLNTSLLDKLKVDIPPELLEVAAIID